MNVVALILSQFVPLALGASLVALLIPRGPGAVPAILGFGYLLGLVLMTLLLRLLSLAGVQWNFIMPALIAALCAAGLLALNRKWPATAAPLVESRPSAFHLSAFFLLTLLVAVHIGLVACEAIVRPLFPWDAAAQWTTKARVWYEFGRMVPFVDDLTWLQSTGNVFTDAHPTYPATVPLFETWAALAWGSWDDAIANISWPISLAALAAAAYGQLRRLGFVAVAAMACAYAIVSLPFVNVHAALAGYADLALAAVYALAMLAFARWLRYRDRGDVILFAVCAIALPLLKAPGWVWLGTLIAGIAWALLPARLCRALAIVAVIAMAGLLLYALKRGPLTVFGYIVALQPAPVASALFDNFYVFANWHLLWIVVPLLMLAEGGRLLDREIGPLTATIATGFVFLAVVFFFSSTAEEGVEAYTTINRAVLHLVPALLIYAALLARDLWTRVTATAAGVVGADAKIEEADRFRVSQAT